MNIACLFTISAPSGAGKTSLIKALLMKKADSIAVSVSHSTRPKRFSEVDGKDYHFVTVNQFKAMIETDKFIEYAKVFGNYYGTARASVKNLLKSGKNVILEIDWQGARQVKQAVPETVSIYVLPPSRSVLEQRLITRATDNSFTIERRMLEADREMARYRDAEYLVINENFEQALYDLECIIHSQRMKLTRQIAKNKTLIDSISGHY